MGVSLPIWETLPLFVLILGVLVLLHELGHFVTAKFFGMSAPEFGLGYPPRLLTLWRSAGWIEIQGRRIVVPGKFKWPGNLVPGAYVNYKTARDARGRETLASAQVVSPEEVTQTLASPVQNLDKGTEYTINALPLGGFVRLSGEEDPTAPNAFAAKPASHRLIVLVAGVTMNFLLALVVMAVMAMNLPPLVTASNTQVVGVVTDSPAATAGIRAGDLIVSINNVDVRNRYDLLRQQIEQYGDRQVQIGIERTGRSGPESITLQITPRAHPPAGQGALGVSLSRGVGVKITGVKPGSLADRIGLRPGDGLVSVGNNFSMLSSDASTFFSTGIRDEQALASYVRSLSGLNYVLPVTYIRNDSLQPVVNLKVPADLPADQADLGLSFHMGPAAATGTAMVQMYEAVASIPRVFATLFQNGPESGGFVGPIGIARLTGEVAARGGFWGILNLLGLLSLNLAIVNLFPFPALDGGRIVFVLLELIRGGKKVNPQKESLIHLIGFLVLISLILFISYYDIAGLLSGKPLLGP